LLPQLNKLTENPGAMFYCPDLIIKAANYDLIQQPNNVVLLDTIAQAYSANSKFDESAKVRSKFLILARNDYERASAHFDRGMAFTFAGKHDDAISDYTQAIRVIPSAALYANRASSYASIGNLTSSITDYTTALSMSDTGSDSYNRHLLYRAQVLTKAGQFPEAITDYRRLIAIAPSNVEARKALILVLADSGKLDEANISLIEFKEKSPEDFKQFRSKLVRIPTLADQSGISASNRLKPRLEAKGERALLHQIKELVRGGKWIMYGKNRIEYKASPATLRPALSGHLQIVNVTCVSDGPQSDLHPVTKGERLIKGCPKDLRQWNVSNLMVDLLKADPFSLDIIEPTSTISVGEGAILQFGYTKDKEKIGWRDCIDDGIFSYQASGEETRRGLIPPGLFCKGQANCRQVKALLSDLIKRVQRANPESAPSYWDTLGYQINQRLWIPDRSGSNQRRRKRGQDHNGKLICFPWIWFRAYRTL